MESAGARSPDHAWELIKLITDREGALTLNTIGGEGALVRPDIMTDQYFQDPNFKVYLENFENTMLHVVPANFRGQEFETTVNNGPPLVQGRGGARRRAAHLERGDPAGARPAGPGLTGGPGARAHGRPH